MTHHLIPPFLLFLIFLSFTHSWEITNILLRRNEYSCFNIPRCPQCEWPFHKFLRLDLLSAPPSTESPALTIRYFSLDRTYVYDNERFLEFAMGDESRACADGFFETFAELGSPDEVQNRTENRLVLWTLDRRYDRIFSNNPDALHLYGYVREQVLVVTPMFSPNSSNDNIVISLSHFAPWWKSIELRLGTMWSIAIVVPVVGVVLVILFGVFRLVEAKRAESPESPVVLSEEEEGEGESGLEFEERRQQHGGDGHRRGEEDRVVNSHRGEDDEEEMEVRVVGFESSGTGSSGSEEEEIGEEEEEIPRRVVWGRDLIEWELSNAPVWDILTIVFPLLMFTSFIFCLVSMSVGIIYEFQVLQYWLFFIPILSPAFSVPCCCYIGFVACCFRVNCTRIGRMKEQQLHCERTALVMLNCAAMITMSVMCLFVSVYAIAALVAASASTLSDFGVQ